MNKEETITIFKIDPTNHNRPLQCKEIPHNHKSIKNELGGLLEIACRIPVSSNTYKEESGIECWDLFVDEEGLLKPLEKAFAIGFKTDDVDQFWTPFLAGNGIIMGCDAGGNSVSVDPMEMMKFKFSLMNPLIKGWPELEAEMKSRLGQFELRSLDDYFFKESD